MKVINCLFVLLFGYAMLSAAEHHEKSIYIPRDFGNDNLESADSKWSLKRMASTENVVLFWAPGFGDNICEAPDLEGHDMKVDLANLLARLESFYKFFYHDLAFVKPGTKADRYKMMVMLDYSLEGTAYGGDYDEEIGALWIAPNRVQDKKLNCIAHELGHSFQSQIACDGEGESWGGHGIFEMASQWMLWRVNPDWPSDENYHLQAFRENTNKAFLHIENIYRSPYILEFWAEKHGDNVIADLFRAAKKGEDPVMTYKQMFWLDQSQFCDEMFDAVRRLVNWDLDYAKENMRQFANDWYTPLDSLSGGWFSPKSNAIPEDYGFNFVKLQLPEESSTIYVDFKGMEKSSVADWRFGLVAVDEYDNSTFSEMMSGKRGTLAFTPPNDKKIEHLWLVVMGAPKVHEKLPDLYMMESDDGNSSKNRTWAYRFKIYQK